MPWGWISAKRSSRRCGGVGGGNECGREDGRSLRSAIAPSPISTTLARILSRRDRVRIAQHFSAGNTQWGASPDGTAEPASGGDSQPSHSGLVFLRPIPGTKVPGYSHGVPPGHIPFRSCVLSARRNTPTGRDCSIAQAARSPRPCGSSSTFQCRVKPEAKQDVLSAGNVKTRLWKVELRRFRLFRYGPWIVSFGRRASSAATSASLTAVQPLRSSILNEVRPASGFRSLTAVQSKR